MENWQVPTAIWSWQRRRRRKEKEGEMVRALIKSNNPFVAGGEKWL